MAARRAFNRLLLGLGAAAALPIPLFGCASANVGRRISAIDTHAHVFHRELDMPDKRRAPSGYDARPEDYLQRLDANGISHGVLVQPSFLGTDNSYLASALRRYAQRFRGIAVVAPDVSPSVLEPLNAAGVVGIRLNLIGVPIPDFSAAPWPALLRWVATNDWQVEVHREARDLPAVISPLLKHEVNVVVDHFGRPDPQLGVDDPGFRYLLSVGGTRRVWVKLSGAYRNGPDGRGQAIALAATPLLRVAYGPERLLWGSDWPHTLFEKSVDYRTTRAQLDAWIPDPTERNVVLADTPARLFRFASG
jgi:predicted TIM-barrel fold metal-dependent hydrolase